MKKFPKWIKREMPIEAINEMNQLLKEYNLHTVCQSARCPNIGECFKNKEATFMILGNICTRNCSFCSVKQGVVSELDLCEPEQIAKAVEKLGLKYVVITSVTRDDLPDGGAGHFVATIKTLRHYNPETKIEVLTPDFNNNINAIYKIILAKPNVFAHNIETVAHLHNKVRPQADYKKSLSFLKYISANSDILTKSSIMLGLGEKENEVFKVIEDLRQVNCNILTIGQYLKPSANCLDVQEFIKPEKFKYYADYANSLGFESVVSAPLVRSSYKAKQSYEEAMLENGCKVT